MSGDVRAQILEVVRPLLELQEEFEEMGGPDSDYWENRFASLVQKISHSTGLDREEVDALFFDYLDMQAMTDFLDCPEGC